MKHLPKNLQSLKLPVFPDRELLLRWQWAPHTVNEFLRLLPHERGSHTHAFCQTYALYCYVRQALAYLKSDESQLQEAAWLARGDELVDLWFPPLWLLEQIPLVQRFLNYVPFRILILPAYEAKMEQALCHFLWNNLVRDFFYILRHFASGIPSLKRAKIFTFRDAFRGHPDRSFFYDAYQQGGLNGDSVKDFLLRNDHED